MTIQFKLKDDHGRYALALLRRKFNSKAGLDKLVKKLLIEEVVTQAKFESRIVEAEIEAEQNYIQWKPGND